MITSPRYWLIIPAAGIGARLNSDKPKQYLSLAGKTVLENTIDCFLSNEKIEKIFVALHSEDEYWNTLTVSHHAKIETVEGGNDRHFSVFNALKVLKEIADNDDFVLVHDAARPCITSNDINLLINSTVDHPVGGLLGAPVTDTLKTIRDNSEKAEDKSTESILDSHNSHVVTKTIDRKTTWAALTPQVFRFKLLYDALRSLIKSGIPVTDESMAIEYAGYEPVIVEGRRDNFKITMPGDLEMAERILDNR